MASTPAGILHAGTSTAPAGELPFPVELLTVTAARDITRRINETAGQLCTLLVRAHDGQAWKALGYMSWQAYVEAELDISRSYAYRQVNLGRVTLALARAIGVEEAEKVSPMGDSVPQITERAARDITPLLDEVTEEISERVAAGEPAADVVPEVVEQAREIARADAAVSATAPAAAAAPAAEIPDEADIDTEQSIADELEAAERTIQQLRADNARLEAENASLVSDDMGREIHRLTALLAQERANNMQHQTTISTLRDQVDYVTKLLMRIRKALGVAQNKDILPALVELKK